MTGRTDRIIQWSMIDLKTAEYLKMLKNEFHTAVMATVDEQGHPVTRVIDIMLADDTTIYFLTAKGKAFYRQLMQQNYVALSAFGGGEGYDKKEASIHIKAVSVQGTVKNIGNEKLDLIFEENPYMKQIYPENESRRALEVFCIEEGIGEFFDLSTIPITRETFAVGKFSAISETEQQEYGISNDCIQCGACLNVCPQSCIRTDCRPYKIVTQHCLHCGNCLSVCPVSAVSFGKQQ